MLYLMKYHQYHQHDDHYLYILDVSLDFESETILGLMMIGGALAMTAAQLHLTKSKLKGCAISCPTVLCRGF